MALTRSDEPGEVGGDPEGVAERGRRIAAAERDDVVEHAGRVHRVAFNLPDEADGAAGDRSGPGLSRISDARADTRQQLVHRRTCRR